MMKRIVYLVACLLMIYVTGCAIKEELPVNYEEYIKRTWVVEDWHGDAYIYHASFCFTITKIEDGRIEWRYCGWPAVSFASHWKFAGTINKNKAMCRLYDGEYEEIGTIEMMFTNTIE